MLSCRQDGLSRLATDRVRAPLRPGPFKRTGWPNRVPNLRGAVQVHVPSLCPMLVDSRRLQGAHGVAGTNDGLPRDYRLSDPLEARTSPFLGWLLVPLRLSLDGAFRFAVPRGSFTPHAERPSYQPGLANR
jgi:hypothetical protein